LESEAGALPALARHLGPQLAARPLGLGEPVLGGRHRSLQPTAGRRHPPRSQGTALGADLNGARLLETDVLVIGAGGAGLRAAIAAADAGVKVLVVCKSLLGKAHTVMAEGGMAAALANVSPLDSWKAHFADTMKGG